MDQSYFQWDNDFITGVPIIDTQHQVLIDTINSALQISINRQSIDLNLVIEVRDKLLRYVDEHFETEHQLMQQFNIDQRHITIHIAAHADFTQSLQQLFTEITALQDPSKLNAFIEFLIRWLANHILTTDKCLSKQIHLIQTEECSASEAYQQALCMLDNPTEPLIKALKTLFFLVSEKNKELATTNQELAHLNEDLTNSLEQKQNELTLAHEKLRILSIHDELTGLYNRRHAMQEIDRLIKIWDRYKSPFSMLFIDIDRFKKVNEFYGYESGDSVLKWFAHFLYDLLRKVDVICRIGADEFLIISTHCDASDLMTLADKINARCKERISPEVAACWKPSLSIGVVEMDPSYKTNSDLLRRAEMAMNEAKSYGGGYSVLASDETE